METTLNETASKFAAEMYEERLRQIQKHGPQDDIRDVPVPCAKHTLLIWSEADCKTACDAAFRGGQGSWAHVAIEELAEAIEAPDDAKRREELIQLATVCMAWVEKIDARQR